MRVAMLASSVSALSASADLGAMNQAAYDPEVALTFAYLSTAAYCGYPRTQNNSGLEAWSCGPACNAVPGLSRVRVVESDVANDAYAFVGSLSTNSSLSAHLNADCVLSFRGTSNLNGWIQDVASLLPVDIQQRGIACSFNGSNCTAGRGWVKSYLSIADRIKAALGELECGNRLAITGHSMGAALGVLAMIDLRHDGYQMAPVYTFGQPRVGDWALDNALEAAGLQVFRVTHGRDPAPHIPVRKASPFHHMPTEVFYPGNFSSGAFVIGDASGEDPAGINKFSALAKLAAACLQTTSTRGKVAACAALFSTFPRHLEYFSDIMGFKMDGGSCLGVSLPPDTVTADPVISII